MSGSYKREEKSRLPAAMMIEVYIDLYTCNVFLSSKSLKHKVS